MDTLKTLMSLIDANSDKIPEGDYLAMCNAMKEVHGNMKSPTIKVRSVDYYDYEVELTNVTLEINRLHKQSDNLHYRSKLTKFMKTEALREYCFKENLHSIEDFTVRTLYEAGVCINFDNLFIQYMEDFNTEVYNNKKSLHAMVEEQRIYRDNIISLMADELD